MANTINTSGMKILFFFVIHLAMFQLAFGGTKYCGAGLRDALKLMCPYGPNGYPMKRGFVMLDDDYNNIIDEDENFALNFDMLPFFNKMETNGLARLRGRREGIVHECCLKPCTKEELMKYCRLPIKQSLK